MDWLYKTISSVPFEWMSLVPLKWLIIIIVLLVIALILRRLNSKKLLKMELVHIFILRKKTQPSENQCDQIIARSKFMLKRLKSGKAYEEIRDRGNYSYKLSAANPNVSGSLSKLMPYFINSQNQRYLTNRKYKIVYENGFDYKSREHYRIAFVLTD